MRYKSAFAGLILGLAVGPVRAGIFDQFEDIGRLTSHMTGISRAPDAIPAMTNPVFVAADEVTYVNEDELVLGVFMNGEARAYPENLGWWHEVINDRIGDQSISVTLCPLTGTGLVFDTTAEDGSQFELGVSGFLINSNLVMYDRRNNRTLYPQMLYIGLNHEYKNERLELLPVVETTWSMWKKMYPDTRAALGGTGMERYSEERQRAYSNLEEYNQYPYGSYRISDKLILSIPTGPLDETFHSKDIVLGLCHNDQTKAYRFKSMPAQAVINDELGGLSLLVVFERDASLALPFYREVNGQVLSFYQVEAEGDLPLEFMDVETGSRWNLRGEAFSGPLAGQRLQQMPAYNSMWFAWSLYWADTAIWNPGEGIIVEPPATAVEGTALAALPEHFILSQNHPNPFNPATHIQYTLPADGLVRLSIYNATGQKIRTLVEGHQERGLYLQDWDGCDDAGAAVSSGAYLYRLEMPGLDLSQTRNMILLR